MRSAFRIGAAGALCMLLAAPTAFAQGTPTGTITGQVVDTQGLALPGVAVTVTSPSLQGSRSAVTSSNGDYILPLLPPGEYTVTFELSGFKTVKRQQRVAAAQSYPLDASLVVAPVSETVTVVSQRAGDISQTSQIATTFKGDLIDKLPLNRSLDATTLMAPGVHNTGPSSALSISGAMSYEALFLVDGVVVNENLRGQSLAGGTLTGVIIEDAVQETTVSTGSISAEFGRFAGGVVNTLTKSGGNEFAGSLRTTFTNDKWRALTPIETQPDAAGKVPADPRVAKIIPIYETTFMGPIVKDKLWFFAAGRYTNQETSRQTSVTLINYVRTITDKRYEGKLTYALTPSHTFKGSYIKDMTSIDNNIQFTVMDLASLFDASQPQDLLSMNYSGILSPKFFVEAQFSRRRFTFENFGSPFTDIINGTLLQDRQRGTRYHTSTFCGGCGPENRDNQNILAKASYFLSTGNLGAHTMVFGVDAFDDQRTADNHQSGSDYRIQGTTSLVRGTDIYPVFNNDGSTFLQWNPIFQNSQGNHFRTYSVFFNDSWRLNNHLSFNLGVRWDKNDGSDALGAKVVKDSAVSPRLAVTWDPKGDGLWTLTAGYAQYVTGIANSVAGAGSAGGQPANLQYTYSGPAINVGNPANPISQDDAIRAVFDWFNANGGIARPLRSSPTIPGLTPVISDALSSPHSNEVTAGVARRLGTRGEARLDGLYRTFKDFYSTRVDRAAGTVTGTVPPPVNATITVDKRIVENTNDLERSYKAIVAQVTYRLTDRFLVSANYTLSDAVGNFDGETVAGGPDTGGTRFFPEYREARWNYPVGDVSIDQRHKTRLWVSYDVPIPTDAGNLTLGVLQFANSGTPYGAIGPVDSRPYVTNPGYLSPPATVDYFFTNRDAFHTDAITHTDLALNYSRNIYRKASVFVRGRIVNVFNQQKLEDITNIDQTVQSPGNSTRTAFNPFTTTPVQGVNWDVGPNFGKARNRLAFQTPRTYEFSVGFRF